VNSLSLKLSPPEALVGALLQGGPQVVDLLLDVPQPGRGLRLQALPIGTTLPPSALPHLLQPCALLLKLRDNFPDLSSPPHRAPMISPREVTSRRIRLLS
jgi:hypothetical protein